MNETFKETLSKAGILTIKPPVVKTILRLLANASFMYFMLWWLTSSPLSSAIGTCVFMIFLVRDARPEFRRTAWQFDSNLGSILANGHRVAGYSEIEFLQIRVVREESEKSTYRVSLAGLDGRRFFIRSCDTENDAKELADLIATHMKRETRTKG